MKIKVETKRIITETVYPTLDDFMKYYFKGAQYDWLDESKVLIYSRHLDPQLMSFAFKVPAVEGLDIDNVDDIKEMIKRGYDERG